MFGCCRGAYGKGKHEWAYLDTDLEGIREKVLKEVSEGKKVALIVNDVETAKRSINTTLKKDLMYYVFILNLQ